MIEYAIYKGDEFLFIGSLEECAKHFNVKRETVRWWSYASNYKRAIKNRKVAIKMKE